jgi:hypothetical protein
VKCEEIKGKRGEGSNRVDERAAATTLFFVDFLEHNGASVLIYTTKQSGGTEQQLILESEAKCIEVPLSGRGRQFFQVGAQSLNH